MIHVCYNDGKRDIQDCSSIRAAEAFITYRLKQATYRNLSMYTIIEGSVLHLYKQRSRTLSGTIKEIVKIER